MLKVHFLIFFLIFFKCSVSFSQIQIKYKIGEEIITNVDILNERKYLDHLLRVAVNNKFISISAIGLIINNLS